LWKFLKKVPKYVEKVSKGKVLRFHNHNFRFLRLLGSKSLSSKVFGNKAFEILKKSSFLGLEASNALRIKFSMFQGFGVSRLLELWAFRVEVSGNQDFRVARILCLSSKFQGRQDIEIVRFQSFKVLGSRKYQDFKVFRIQGFSI
jgi:hypothetical protein